MVDETLHGIFVTNPVELLNFVDKPVKITLRNGEIVTGTVYTIDPVSQSVALFTTEKTGEMSFKIVLKHSMTEMQILEETLTDQRNVLTDDIFKANQSSSNKNTKDDVKNWLLKNMIPVIENGDILEIDMLEIHPPYGVEQCFSSNPIVLSRIQMLLKQMQSKSNDT